MSQGMHGIFNVCKPQGFTSFDVVAKIRRLTKQKRVGHAGTLDPDAVGVLPICVGQATRLVEYLADASKEYCAELRLGLTTDTYDATGSITAQSDYSQITLHQIEQTIGRFVGKIKQIPPMYSAIKLEGRKLYELARAGQTVERKPRDVEIFRLDLVDWEPPSLVLRVECSKGTYIRSLAQDIGQCLGTGAIMQHLVRLRTGPFHLDDSITLDQLELAVKLDFWRDLIYAADSILGKWPAVIVNSDTELAITQGKEIRFGSPSGGEQSPLHDRANEASETASEQGQASCRAYTTDGRFLAVLLGNPATREWRPHKVFLQMEPLMS